jgi:hypothetical protein
MGWFGRLWLSGIMDTLYTKYGYKTGFYRIGFNWLVFLDIDSLSSLDIDSLSPRK